MTARRAAAALVVLGVLGATGPGARADRAADDETAVFMVPARGASLSRARQATLLSSMTQALHRERPGVVAIDTDLRLARQAGALPAEAVGDARSALDRGEDLFSRGEAKKALPHLERAAEKLATLLTHAPKRDLAKAQLLIGAARSALGDDRRARRSFESLLTWRPDFAAGGPFASLQGDPNWQAAARAVADRGLGALELESEPSGALAYVDGQFVGFTPTTAADLAVGTHYVTFKLTGHARTVVTARVSKRRRRTVQGRLTPSPRGDEVAALVAEIAGGGDPYGERTRELGQLLAVERAIFVHVPSPGQADVSYRAALLDLRAGKELATVTVTAAKGRPPAELFGQLVRSLYGAAVARPGPAQPEPVIEDPMRPAPAPPANRRFYQRWWFWTGVAVIAAAAIAVPLVLLSDDPPPDGAATPGPSRGSPGAVLWRF